ncbi:MAG: thiamine phosphate synthase, partial [Lentisphaerae bacterium]
CKIVQLRDKVSNRNQLYRKARQFRQVTRECGMLLIINDHVDIAMAVDADGVHLGQEDFPVAAARRLLPDKLIGVSCHSLVEAVLAKQDGADYYNIGPIFSTSTKEHLSNFLGVDAIRQIGREVDLPFTVMGGINRNNIEEVLRAGARHVAVVSAVTAADNVIEAAKELREIIQSYHTSSSE